MVVDPPLNFPTGDDSEEEAGDDDNTADADIKRKYKVTKIRLIILLQVLLTEARRLR